MSDGPSYPAMYYADWLQRHAVTRGNSAAIVTPQGTLNYGGFYRALHAAAYRLSESGIEAGQTVGLCVLNPALHCVLLAALNRMGCVPTVLARPLKAGIAVPEPEGFAVDRVLVEQPFDGALPKGAVDVHFDWLKTPKQNVREWQSPGLRDGNAMAHIFTSSGTTGAVKAVAYSTRQLETRFFRRSIGILSTGHSGKVLCQFGLRSTIGYQTVFSTFWAGGTAYLGFPDAAVPALVARQGIQRIEASPQQYQGLMQTSDPARFDLSSLRYALVGGSTIAQALIASLRSKICRVLIGQYGATELGMVSFGPLRAVDPQGCCGHVVPWMQAEAVDPQDKPLPAGTEGILRFRCEEMATGYLNDPEASAQYFKNGWFYPGDIGTIGEDLALTITGRSSERINAGGVKVGPEIIEEVVLSYDGVVDCAAFGVPGVLGVEKICAAIVVDRKIDLEKLRDFCLSKLSHRAPEQFFTLSELPRSDTGKILRSTLPKLTAEAAPKRKPARRKKKV
jgi:long-chain acyl-CoA synthetase